MSANSELSINVHVAPMRGFVTSAAPPAGIRAMWSPLCSTLIAGERDAILVDTTITYDQVDRLADWVERFGKQVAGVVITRGHSDHWIGLARLQERLPHARGLATRDVLAHARFEATEEGMRAYWRGLFPGEIPEVPVLPELFDGDSIDLDGHELRVIDVGQGDIAHSTIVRVPSLRAVVAGDVVYNKVHMFTALTDATAREAAARRRCRAMADARPAKSPPISPITGLDRPACVLLLVCCPRPTPGRATARSPAPWRSSASAGRC